MKNKNKKNMRKIVITQKKLKKHWSILNKTKINFKSKERIDTEIF